MRRRPIGIPACRCLIGWAMRGHHPPPDPWTMTEAELAAAAAPRAWSGVQRRWMTAGLGRLTREVVLRLADRWGVRVEEVVIGRTCVYARVCVQDLYAAWMFGPAVNVIATRRARRELGWPRGERVFTRRGRRWELGPGDEAPGALLRRNPALALL